MMEGGQRWRQMRLHWQKSLKMACAWSGATMYVGITRLGAPETLILEALPVRKKQTACTGCWSTAT